MHNGEVFLEAEVAEATSRQNAEELDGVHCLHVPVLSEAVSTVLIRVEYRGKAAIHVEGLVIEPLEDLPVDVGFQGVLCMVGSGYGVGEGGGGSGVVHGGGGGGGGLYGTNSCRDIPMC